MQLLEPPIREMLAAKGLEVATTRKGAVTTQDVAMAIAPPQEATPTVARVLLDFTVPGEATLLLIDPRRGRVYARRMALANGLDAVARASVRFVIEQSIDAILEGRDIGVSREEFQRSVAPPPPAAEPPPPAPAPAPAPVPAPAPATNSAAAGGRLRRPRDGIERVPARRQGRGRRALRPPADRRGGAAGGPDVDRRRRRAGPAFSRRRQPVSGGTVPEPRQLLRLRRVGRRPRRDARRARRHHPRPAARGVLLGPRSLGATLRRDRTALRQDLAWLLSSAPRFTCSPNATR